MKDSANQSKNDAKIEGRGSAKKIKQSYKYIKEKSILAGLSDDFQLTENEYYRLYSFFVTYSLCERQSMRQRTLVDYGWDNNRMNHNGLKKALQEIWNFDDQMNKCFKFTVENNLKEQFQELNLVDGGCEDYFDERFAIGHTSQSNQYYKVFHHIRNCLCHGKFVLKLNSSEIRMIIMQDDAGQNVTARMVLSLDALFDIIDIIDRNGIIGDSQKELQAEAV